MLVIESGATQPQHAARIVMLIVSPATASALALHAVEQSWVMFVQTNVRGLGAGPIKIEAVKGTQIASRLNELAANNPFEVLLIGLTPTPTPHDLVLQLSAQFEAQHMHDGWFESTPNLIALVQAIGQHALQELLAQTHPGGLTDAPVGIAEMAALLDVSVPTVRRMVHANAIPFMRYGRTLRFVPADVFASLRR